MASSASSPMLLTPPQGRLCIDDRSSISGSIAFSLIVPTYNEAKNVTALVDRITTLLDPMYPGDYEIIIVDDNSPDGTWEVAQSIMSAYPQLRVMRRQTERGLSTAVIRGWQAAKGDVLGVIDGDLQHPPEVLLGLLAKMKTGADFAIASRHVEGGGCSDWGLIRRLLSRGAQVLGLIILPSVVGRVTDPMSGCFMVQRAAISGVVLDPLGYKISLEILGRGRVDRIEEVGYVFQERQEGESKVTRKQIVHILQIGRANV